MGMPKEIAGPLHQALFDEIAWATEDEVRADSRSAAEHQGALLCAPAPRRFRC